jgi:hypothetical protein
MTRSFSAHMREEARRLVARDVLRVVATVHGESAVADDAAPRPGDLFGRLRPVDPLLRGQAEKLMHEFVAEARGRGVPWFKIAPGLQASDGTDYDQLVAAFSWATTDGAYFHFKCLCGGNIRDTGPENGRPTNAESGHLDGCGSLSSHMAAYEAWQEEEASIGVRGEA